MAFYGCEKLLLLKMTLSLCNQKLRNDDIPVILFHLFFFHKSYHINHQVMAFYGSEKLIVAKMTLSLCYQKLMNDNNPVILLHLFFFHKS